MQYKNKPFHRGSIYILRSNLKADAEVGILTGHQHLAPEQLPNKPLVRPTHPQKHEGLNQSILRWMDESLNSLYVLARESERNWAENGFKWIENSNPITVSLLWWNCYNSNMNKGAIEERARRHGFWTLLKEKNDWGWESISQARHFFYSPFTYIIYIYMTKNGNPSRLA